MGHALAVGGQDLEMSDTQERWRHPADDGARLGARVAVVEHVAHHRLARRHQRERTRGRHAEVCHRLGAEQLAQRGAQHGASVALARIGCWPGALELQLPPHASRTDADLTERDCTTVAELVGPMAELMTAVAPRVGLAAGQGGVAGEDRGSGGSGGVVQALG